MSSTSSDSETEYLTPLTDLRKEELLQKERELLSRSKSSKKKKSNEKREKRKRKKRWTIIYCALISWLTLKIVYLLLAHQALRVKVVAVQAQHQRIVQAHQVAAAVAVALVHQVVRIPIRVTHRKTKLRINDAKTMTSERMYQSEKYWRSVKPIENRLRRVQIEDGTMSLHSRYFTGFSSQFLIINIFYLFHFSISFTNSIKQILWNDT